MTLELLHAVVDGRNLSQAEAEIAMSALLSGASTPVLTSAFLTALRMRGETIEELAGFATAMRAAALPFDIAPECRPLLDTCGTGGNAIDAFNISTVVAFVVAGAGVRIAKHGNRAITSKCGSADVLEALGVNTRVEPPVIARSIREAGIGFLFAPTFHTATRNVQAVRLELKFRTAFNYLGPLTNPAHPEMQVCGTWSDEAAEKIAGALTLLGLERGYVVHGSDGLGEATLTGPSTVFWVRTGRTHTSVVAPEDFGFEPCSLDDLRGGDAETNRAITEAVLTGEEGPRRDIVLMNAALALIAAGKAATFTEGVAVAAETIDSGAALQKLRQLREITAIVA